MRSRLNTMFRSLMIRNFRLFTTGQLVKLIGVWAQFTAQVWLVPQLSHNSPTALGCSISRSKIARRVGSPSAAQPVVA